MIDLQKVERGTYTQKNRNFSLIFQLFIFTFICAIAFGSVVSTTNAQTKSSEESLGRVAPPKMPTKADFCGEQVPLDNFEIRERFDSEMLANTFQHSSTLRNLKRSSRYFPIIEPILQKYGVPDDFKYLAIVESGLANLVSSAQAAGFWQFLSSTGAGYGLEINNEVDERYDVEKATIAACKHLRELYAKFNSWTLAAAAYNYGQGNLSASLQAQKVNSYYDLLINEETTRYVIRIVVVKEFFKNPKNFGYFLDEDDYYQPIKTSQIEVKGSIPNVVEFARAHNTTYKMVKLLNPWLRGDKLTNASKKTYIVKLPE